ncbi:transposase, MuDR, MULE transposase domain protein [Tanacetum coccineum]
MVMLNMYEEEKEVTIYVITDNCIQERSQDEVTNEIQGENGSDSDCQSENSYHTRHSTDDECDKQNYEPESHSYNMNSPAMELHKKFPNVIEFRRALNHYVVINEFEYKIEKSDLERLTACCEDKKCEWKIHASTTEDKITFQVKKFVETHSCTRSNKCGNKRATQGWIANVIVDF